jgi:histidine ammonia-lyase
VLAIEILSAARALDLRAPLLPGRWTGAVHDVVRTVVSGPGPDRHLALEIDAVVDLVTSRAITTAAPVHPVG